MSLTKIAFALALCAGPAGAATSSGHAALAVGAIVGGYTPAVTASQKSALAKVLDGAVVAGPPIHIDADSIVCYAGDVDIAAFHCDLQAGPWKLSLTGRKANELFASLAGMGVATDGAAGKIYVAVSKLRCVIAPAKIARRDGEGADCTYSTE